MYNVSFPTTQKENHDWPFFGFGNDNVVTENINSGITFSWYLNGIFLWRKYVSLEENICVS